MINKIKAASNVFITMIEKHPETKTELLKIINNYQDFNCYSCSNLSVSEWEILKEHVNNHFMEV